MAGPLVRSLALITVYEGDKWHECGDRYFSIKVSNVVSPYGWSSQSSLLCLSSVLEPHVAGRSCGVWSLSIIFWYRRDEGAKVVVVEDIQNPYRASHSFDNRFLFTLNKIYAWSLTEYQRVVMLDVDNLFLRKPDELFQCGQFCAVFINPCIFHTGLFVLQVRYSESFPLSESLFVVPLTYTYIIFCIPSRLHSYDFDVSWSAAIKWDIQYYDAWHHKCEAEQGWSWSRFLG